MAGLPALSQNAELEFQRRSGRVLAAALVYYSIGEGAPCLISSRAARGARRRIPPMDIGVPEVAFLSRLV